MDRVPVLHHPRHEQDAQRERDERGRDMDTQGREPERREAHRQLLDRERREFVKIEVREAQREDECCAERHRPEEQEAEAVGTNAIPHPGLDACDRAKSGERLAFERPVNVLPREPGKAIRTTSSGDFKT